MTHRKHRKGGQVLQDNRNAKINEQRLRTHMQTDCPTNVMRDEQMKGNRNSRMRQKLVIETTLLDMKK